MDESKATEISVGSVVGVAAVAPCDVGGGQYCSTLETVVLVFFVYIYSILFVGFSGIDLVAPVMCLRNNVQTN